MSSSVVQCLVFTMYCLVRVRPSNWIKGQNYFISVWITCLASEKITWKSSTFFFCYNFSPFWELLKENIGFFLFICLVSISKVKVFLVFPVVWRGALPWLVFHSIIVSCDGGLCCVVICNSPDWYRTYYACNMSQLLLILPQIYTIMEHSAGNFTRKQLLARQKITKLCWF